MSMNTTRKTQFNSGMLLLLPLRLPLPLPTWASCPSRTRAWPSGATARCTWSPSPRHRCRARAALRAGGSSGHLRARDGPHEVGLRDLLLAVHRCRDEVPLEEEGRVTGRLSIADARRHVDLEPAGGADANRGREIGGLGVPEPADLEEHGDVVGEGADPGDPESVAGRLDKQSCGRFGYSSGRVARCRRRGTCLSCLSPSSGCRSCSPRPPSPPP